MNEQDQIARWPQKWRAMFECENSLLADEGEETLTTGEFLQCRYDDWLEATEALRIARAERHHEVFLAMLVARQADYAARETLVLDARNIADLAYPPVKP